jgi:hypothetical protein
MSEVMRSYHDFAQVSLASYATLPSGPPLPDDLKTLNDDRAFSESLALNFANRYMVLHQQGGAEARKPVLLHTRIVNLDQSIPRTCPGSGVDLKI